MPRTTNAGWYALRFAILERDNYTCRYCGRSAPSVPLEVDHIIAVADGGTDESSNLVACCWSCNRSKEGLRARRTQPRSRVAVASAVARYKNLPCVECGGASDSLHFVPWCVPIWREEQWVFPEIVTACIEHDPDGYWLRISDVLTNTAHWLRHLGGKRGRPDRSLAEWVSSVAPEPATWTLRCAACRTDYRWDETFACVSCTQDFCSQCWRAGHLSRCDADADERRDNNYTDPPSKEIRAVMLGGPIKERTVAVWNGKAY